MQKGKKFVWGSEKQGGDSDQCLFGLAMIHSRARAMQPGVWEAGEKRRGGGGASGEEGRVGGWGGGPCGRVYRPRCKQVTVDYKDPIS